MLFRSKREGRAGAEVSVGEFLVVADVGSTDSSGFDGDLELVVLGRCDVTGFLGVLVWAVRDGYEVRDKIKYMKINCTCCVQ